MEPRLFQALVDDAAQVCGAAVVELHALPELVGSSRLTLAPALPPFAAAAVGGSLLQPRKRREESLRRLRELAESGFLPPAPHPPPELRIVRCADRVPLALEVGTALAPGQVWCADAPLLVDGTIAGVLRLLLDEQPRKSLVRALKGLGHQAALHLAQVQRERSSGEELKRQQKRAHQLAGLGLRLLRERDRGMLLRAFGHELQQLGAQSMVLLLDGDGRLAVAHLSHPARAISDALSLLGLTRVSQLGGLALLPERAPLVLRLLESDRPTPGVSAERLMGALLGRSIPRTVREAIVERLGLQHLAAAPLPGADGMPQGLLVAALQSPEVDLSWLGSAAAQLSLALDRTSALERLQSSSAEHDAALRDLRDENERLLEHDRRKDNFLANVSHELRSPMVTTLGYTDLLLAEKLGPLSEKQRQCLSVVKSSGRRLKAFIEELLDFSRFELTRESMNLTSFDVGEAIAQVVAALQPRLMERRINVRQRIARGTPRLRADRDRILQVLTNLVHNAEKHVPDGGRIQLTADARGDRIVVSVQDNGTGIPPEHQSKIFDRLYQVGDVKDGKQRQGLGLGLNIVKSIVQAHGGAVAVQSAVGKGSTFTVSLPLEGPPGAAHRARAGEA
jgi:signal transduction histidine kinase